MDLDRRDAKRTNRNINGACAVLCLCALLMLLAGCELHVGEQVSSYYVLISDEGAKHVF